MTGEAGDERRKDSQELMPCFSNCRWFAAHCSGDFLWTARPFRALFPIQTHIQHHGRVRQRAGADSIDASLGNGTHRLEIDSARGFEFHLGSHLIADLDRFA